MSLDEVGRPMDLLGSGHHFRDTGKGRRPVVVRDLRTPMHNMMRQMVDRDLRRPAIITKIESKLFFIFFNKT